MVRLGGTASASHMTVFQGLEKLFRNQGIDLDWVLYSDHDMMVDAFVAGEIDLAWNGPLSYVQIKRLIDEPCKVIAMRDVDLNYSIQFITQHDSDILTVEDLMGKRFAFGSRSSVEAGLLANYFLRQSGIDPRRDLAASSFHEERQPSSHSDQRDVVERVRKGEYDAGVVSKRSLSVLQEQGSIPANSVRAFWSSPEFSHCCFTAQGNMDPGVYDRLAKAFVSVDDSDPIGKEVLEAEACDSLVPGITEGWEILEKVAEQEGLL